MSFNLGFPSSNEVFTALHLEPGEMMFVLGANGTGKSSLVQRFGSQNLGRMKRISAHRQTWMGFENLDMTPAKKIEYEGYIRSEDSDQESRFKDDYATHRTSLAIYGLIEAENLLARRIAEAWRAKQMDKLTEWGETEPPITGVNELLRQSNIPITISISDKGQVLAQKNGGPEYGVAELSDGERSAVLLAADVLTVPKGTLLIIDEPERHLHRSIISPLLSQLFERRTDCGFVISTHDHDLPLGHQKARTLLLRSCAFQGKAAHNWVADEITADTSIDDVLRRDLLGGRRKILFVEGTEGSLDKPLYSLIFPMVSVIPKGSCREVEQAVIGLQAGESFHWLEAFGIIDGDGFDESDRAEKRERGIYALPYYSVEAIYFHPWIIKMIATRKAEALGGDAETLETDALAAGVDAISRHTDRLSEKVAKKTAWKKVIEQLPNVEDLLAGEDIKIANDSPATHKARKVELETAIEAGDWETILTAYPVRETEALGAISTALRFLKIKDYQIAVRRLLSDDPAALEFVQGLFDDLPGQLGALESDKDMEAA